MEDKQTHNEKFNTEKNKRKAKFFSLIKKGCGCLVTCVPFATVVIIKKHIGKK